MKVHFVTALGAATALEEMTAAPADAGLGAIVIAIGAAPARIDERLSRLWNY